MKKYGVFAYYYDALTRNVEYKKQCDYFMQLFEKYHMMPKLIVDLACGTGSLAFEFARRGIEVIGVDASEDMLTVAQQKKNENHLDVLFLCQKMQQLDLYGTIDAVVCTLDSINHLLNEKDVQETFRRVSLFLNPGGLFLFDVNTIYKHMEVLGNHTYVYDIDSVFCVWQNATSAARKVTRIQLDFFERERGDLYRRQSETFSERAYACEDLIVWLQAAEFEVLDIFEEMTFCKPHAKAERLIFIARKKEGDWKK